MNDDLAFVTGLIPSYRGYDVATERADSDMRVRAYVGEALTRVQSRLGGALSSESRATLESVLYRCMFTDQVFVRNFEHAELEAPMIAALVHSDRVLIGYGNDAKSVSADDLPALVAAIDAQYDYRRSPAPLFAD